jgi:HEAT repeat protein
VAVLLCAPLLPAAPSRASDTSVAAGSAEPEAGRAEFDELEFARKLVRRHYVEGLPYARARQLTPAGVEILIEMLEDPAEAEYRDNIVMALGISGDPRVYPALTRFHEHPLEGEVDSAEYRARRALPFAMGHLARSDSRAFHFLLEAARAEGPGSAPRWSYRYLRDERLAGILRRAAIRGLAMSGRPEAAAVLEELGARARDDPAATEELRTHIREAREFCDRVVREGPDRVFDRDAAP